MLGADPGARPLAGGTDLVVQLRDGRCRARRLVDLSGLGLASIHEREDGGVEIGAGAVMDDIARHPAVRRAAPALAGAAARVGAWPIQCRATLGGNLANASPAADTAPPLLVAGAEVTVASASGGCRTVPLNGFFLAPGRTCLLPGELLVSVLVPAPPRGEVRERFTKVGPRREQVIAVVSLAGRAVVGRGGVLTGVRLALGSVAPIPVRARAAEGVLEGRRPDAAVAREAMTALQADIAPIDDVRATARYRRLAAAALLRRFLDDGRG